MSRFVLSLVLFSLVSCRTDPLSKGTGLDSGSLETGETAAGVVDADEDGFDANEDCDDSNPDIHPDATEVCNGLDDNCDGLVDDADPAIDTTTQTAWYRDADSDGFGNEDDTVSACIAPAWHVEESASGFDCDDTDPAYHPGAEESDCTDPNDYNCDGSVAYEDSDADGWPACMECNDADAAINPDASEVCDEVDNDCDGDIDDADDSLDSSTASDWYADSDSDGYGDPTTSERLCEMPTGYVADNTDCDDNNAPNTYPGADEYCDGVDTDCDGTLDEDDALDASTWYADSDNDTYGDPNSTHAACSQPSGYVADNTDCDDSTNSVHPAATEYCNSVDDNCDGTTDEDSAADASTWYADSDSDTYGDPNSTHAACSQPSGYVADNTDCDDASAPNTYPGADEYCDGVDTDCDGTLDEDDALDASTWYGDSDSDNYGGSSSTTKACAQPSGYASVDTDCDDSDATVNPGASESCDGKDNDCDGTADSSSVCPCAVRYNSDNTHPYMFCTSSKSWNSGRSHCQSYGYDLASLTSSSENTWVDNTADSFSTAKWHMGFTDQWSEGTWVWSNGDATSYTNWHSGEPNGGTSESCGQINRFHPTQTWNDEPCGQSLRYVCEVD